MLNAAQVLISQTEEDSALNTMQVRFSQDFTDLGLLGSGAFAYVYKVVDKHDNQLYAVKKSKRPFRSRSDRKLLMNEVRKMKRLCEVTNYYMIRFIKAWQEDGYFFAQIDLASGSVKEVIDEAVARNHTIPEALIWKIAHDALCGLQHIHACNVVHLDIKPAN
jgi:serine/threonine protein kinase